MEYLGSAATVAAVAVGVVAFVLNVYYIRLAKRQLENAELDRGLKQHQLALADNERKLQGILLKKAALDLDRKQAGGA